MTVPLEPLGVTYQADGTTTDFPIPFSFVDPTDVQVAATSPEGAGTGGAGQVVTPLRQPADFQVVTVLGQGYVRTTVVYANGWTISLDRDTPPTQEVDLVPGGDFFADVIDGEFDKLTRGWAEMRREVGLAVGMPPGWTGGKVYFPIPGAGRVVGWDAAGNDLTTYELPADGGGGGGGGAVQLPFLTGQALGLFFDGTTDAGPALQQAIDRLARASGGTIWLAPPETGGSLFLGGKVRVWGGVNLVAPIDLRLGRDGGAGVIGRLAERPLAGRILLRSPVAKGDTVLPLDTRLLGGVPVPSLLAVGDRVVVRGRCDSCGTPLEWDDLAVAAVGPDSITVDQGVGYAFGTSYPPNPYMLGEGQPDGTAIIPQVSVPLAADTAEGALRATLAVAGALSIGQWVAAEDGMVAGDVAGTSTARIHRSLVQVRNVSGTSVTFDRPLEHALLTAKKARLTVVEPAGGTVEGATAVFTAAVDPADPSTTRTFEMAYAVGATVVDCRVPNTDAFGHPSDALRLKLSADCWFLGCSVAYPKFLDPGQGYGFFADWAVDSGCEDCEFRGCRHSVGFGGASRCYAYTPKSLDCRVSDWDFHGALETDCHIIGGEITGGVASVSGSRAAVGFGNSFHLAGSRRCSVTGGSIDHYRAPQTVPGTPDYTVLAIDFECGVKDCHVLGVKVRDVDQLVQVLDNPDQPQLVVDGCSVDVELDTCGGYVAWIRGNHYGTTTPGVGTYRIRDFGLKVAARNVGKLCHLERIDGLEAELSVGGVTVDASEPYLGRVLDVRRARLATPDVAGTARGWQVQNCPGGAWRDGGRLAGLTQGEVLDDLGGNDAFVVGEQSYEGFTPTLGGALTSKLIFRGRTPDSLNIAGEAMIGAMPTFERARMTVWSLSGEQLDFAFECAVSPAIAYVPHGTANVAVLDGLTGPPAVADAPAGTLCAAPEPAGVVWLINRRGGQRGVRWSWT
jgi:hypothetical protein